MQGILGNGHRNLGAGLDPDSAHEVDGEVRGQLELPEGRISRWLTASRSPFLGLNKGTVDSAMAMLLFPVRSLRSRFWWLLSREV